MPMRRFALPTWAIPLLVPLQALAQEARTDTGQLLLPEVVVQAPEGADVQGFVARRSTAATKTNTPLSELPQSVSVVTRDQIDARQAQSLGQALGYTSGVRVDAFGADPHVDFFSLRGFNANDFGLYQDGLRLSPGTTALAIEPYGLQRIDVLKGPSSVLYGQNAPGGLVNLVSKRPTGAPYREVELLGGSFGRIQGQADLSGPVTKDGKWSYRLTGLARGAGTQVDRVPNDRLFVAPALTWRPDADTEFTLLTSFQKDNTAGAQFLPSQGTVFANPNGRIPRKLFTGEDQYNKVDRFQANLGYQFEHRFNDVFTVRQNFRTTRIDYSQRQVFGLGFQPDLRTLDRSAFGLDVRSNIYAVDNQVQANVATGPLRHTVLGGFDYSRTTIANVGRSASATPLDLFAPVYGGLQPGELSIYANTYQAANQFGLYAQDQVKLDRWVLTVGGRQDWVDARTDSRTGGSVQSQSSAVFTYRAGLAYVSDLGITPYASYARSFQPVYGVNLSGRTFQPSEGEQVEVGLKYQPTGLNSYATASAFDLTQTNVATPDPGNAFNTLQTGEVRVRGFEVETVASLAQRLNLIASYTYLDPVITKANDGTAGNQLGGTPRHIASAFADYAVADTGTRLDGLSFGGGVRYIGSSQAGNANSFKVPDTTLFDAAVRYDFGRWRLAVNANNLFDRTFVAQCSGPAFCFYGARREVLASLRVRW